MTPRSWARVSVALLLTALGWVPAASAMPNFARKYGWDCAMCHTTIPKLNRFGYDFRKAGFRPPDDIGKPNKTDFADTFAARIQARYDDNHRNDSGAKTSTRQLTLHEVTLYPLSASFGKYYASLMELSIAGEDFVEIENAYFRYARGSNDAWFSGRVGIFHPFEGYGASDRPYSISRPLFQTVAANQDQSTFFTPWNFDQAGLELAYVYKGTSVSGTLFNGLFVRNDEGAFKAFPAGGGELVKSSGFPKANAKDVQLFVNQVLKDDGSGISGYFYAGSMALPIPGTSADDFAAATSWGNTYYRAAIYGSYRVLPKLDLLAAYQIGRDHLYDVLTASPGGTFNSEGWFAEADVPASSHVTLGARFERFDPSKDKADNARTGATVYANMPINDGVQVIAEFRHIAQERAGREDLKDNNGQVRFIWIW